MLLTRFSLSIANLAKVADLPIMQENVADLRILLPIYTAPFALL